MLYGVPPGDPLTFVSAAAVLIAVAALASALPGLRAAHTDPVETLRN
jgi:ABC-type lipoprotein release transport system permease subunit